MEIRRCRAPTGNPFGIKLTFLPAVVPPDHPGLIQAIIGTSGNRVAEEPIQMHGGMGMTRELLAANAAKRLIMIDHQIGDADHPLDRCVAMGQAA